MKTTLPALLIRLAIGIVLIYAGFAKAIRPTAEFAAMIEAYKILPTGLLTPAALALPYIEMWVGIFVLFGLYARQAPLAATALFGMFLIALGSAMARGIDLVSCGCFGADALSPKTTVIMDTVLLLLSLVLFRFNKYPQPLTLDDFLS